MKRNALVCTAGARFKLADGAALFNHKFYAAHPFDSQAFIAEIALAARSAEPTRAHRAIAALGRTGKLIRHYTMNVDGLHARPGLASTTDPKPTIGHPGPPGKKNADVVELHGTTAELVDVESGSIEPATASKIQQFRSKKLVVSETTGRPVRFKVLLYDDPDSAVITDAAALQLLRQDAEQADLVLWIGVSFSQSATCGYLQLVTDAVDKVGAANGGKAKLANPESAEPSDAGMGETRPLRPLQLIINPDPEAFDNASSVLNAEAGQGSCEIKLYPTLLL